MDFREQLYGCRSKQSPLFEAGWPRDARTTPDGIVELKVPLQVVGSDQLTDQELLVRIQACSSYGLRIGVTRATGTSSIMEGSPMIETLPPASALRLEPLPAGGWRAVDAGGTVRMQIQPPQVIPEKWSDLLPPPPGKLELTLFPDGKTRVKLAAHDHFFPAKVDAVALGACLDAEGSLRIMGGAFEIEANEVLCGTGERFAKIDLSGRTIRLENEDAMGVNNRAAYKNVPWVLSSRGYGVFLHTSLPATLSLADHSTRSWQFSIPDDSLDFFVIGGGAPERVLGHYRRLTGIPRPVPRWSLGIWMSRMTYFSASEVEAITKRLREEDWPCDVIHIDTGWFAKDWICEWEFGDNFPDPEGFLKRLLDDGFRVSLWQNPNILKECRWVDELVEKGYLGKPREAATGRSDDSDFSAREIVGQIDFSNPEAAAWYKRKIRRLLEMGAVAIKTDFGETINMEAEYAGIPAERLRNLYALLYQQAASDETMDTLGHGLIWARAGWAGCQRYPVHWGGDCACTWDGMAGSLRGGLHLGLSGFAFWSHDVPGFHGLPDFMNSRPDPLLYLRWTQFATFTSHIRYHGTSEREPWFYPEVAGAVKAWWRLRYVLIPYIERESNALLETGRPFLAALCFEDPDDPTAWRIDDQFMAGRDILVAPMLSASSQRNVWLPHGEWLDVWSGQEHTGRQWLYGVQHEARTCPVYLRKGARIPVCPVPVASTNDFKDGDVVEIVADNGYKGIFAGPVGGLLGSLQ